MRRASSSSATRTVGHSSSKAPACADVACGAMPPLAAMWASGPYGRASAAEACTWLSPRLACPGGLPARHLQRQSQPVTCRLQCWCLPGGAPACAGTDAAPAVLPPRAWAARPVQLVPRHLLHRFRLRPAALPATWPRGPPRAQPAGQATIITVQGHCVEHTPAAGGHAACQASSGCSRGLAMQIARCAGPRVLAQEGPACLFKQRCTVPAPPAK